MGSCVWVLVATAVLMARERGRIGADAALGDIPKRLWAHAFDEMDDGPAR